MQTIIKKIDISFEDLLTLSKKQVDSDMDEIDNRDRLIDNLIAYGSKSDDKTEFDEQLISAILNYYEKEKLFELIKKYEIDYLEE